jgi:hypothetical protein
MKLQKIDILVHNFMQYITYPILCFVLLLVIIYLFLDMRSMALKLARLHGTLVKVAEFHYDHINRHECESWEQYKKDH